MCCVAADCPLTTRWTEVAAWVACLALLKSHWLLQVQGDTLLVANAGDSRCVVSEAGKAVPMSFDHKPTDEKEHSRIIKVILLPH